MVGYICRVGGLLLIGLGDEGIWGCVWRYSERRMIEGESIGGV